jgi:hypothetical protein
MIPSFLTDLYLESVFEKYSSKVERYIQCSEKSEYIVDSEKGKISGFVTKHFGQDEYLSEKYFHVENPSSKQYALLQIDRGIIKANDIPKCDCAIANDNELCFIEFKANATSENSSVIDRNYQKAMLQLATTISIFDSYKYPKGNIRNLRNVEAFICLRQGYPRNKSSQMNYRISFAEANKIPLSFASAKTI